MKIIITENQKNNLFKPRNIKSRYDKWNSEQPIVDGIQINQYNSEGKKTGLWEYNFHNGAKSLKHYENGELNGYAKYIWSNGNLSAEGIYSNNKQVGIWKHYNQDGELLSQTKK